MADALASWARASIEPDLRAYATARERFVARATSRRLHRLRAAARRLRSAFEDVAELVAADTVRSMLADIGDILGKPRDFHVQRRLLASVLQATPRSERRNIKKFLKRLCRRERRRLNRALIAVREIPPLEIPQ